MALPWLTRPGLSDPTESVFSHKQNGLNDLGYNNKPPLGVAQGKILLSYGCLVERWWEYTVFLR